MGSTGIREPGSQEEGVPSQGGRRRGSGRLHSSRRLARLTGWLTAIALAMAGLGNFAPTASAAEEESVTFPGGPLSVSVGPLGQCQSSYENHGNNYYPPNGNTGDCGFFLAFPKSGNVGKGAGTTGLQAQTYGFNGEALGGFSKEGPLDLYTFEKKSSVTGSGSAGEPYTLTTQYGVNDVEKPATKYAQVTDTTTYVNGEAQFISTYKVKNESGETIHFRAMYAGDLFVNGNDHGTGVYLGGPPQFIGGLNAAQGVVGGFQEAPGAPAWSAFQELPWPTVWSTVQNTVEEPHAFNNTIEAAEVDNAAGVEWDQFREGTGLQSGEEASFAIINRTSVPSNLQISPVNQTLAQGQTATINLSALDIAKQPYAGKVVHYSITGANPQAGTVTLNSSGQAQIAYVGHNAGIDTVQMFVDLAGSGVQTPGDPSATATVTFTPTPNSSYKIQSIKANSDGTITIVFVPTQSGTATVEVTVPTGTISRREAIAAKKAKKCKKGQIRIKGKCRPATTVSGKLSAAGTAGVPLTLTVKPSSKVKRALKKGKTIHLTATLTYRSALGGTPTVEVFHETIKPHKKKKH